jgi:site-specific recombinase XerD
MRETFDHASKIKQEQASQCDNQDEKGMLLRDASILEKASAHWLRHSHATYFLKMSNQNLKLTMTRLGHSDVSTTMIYLHEENEFSS